MWGMLSVQPEMLACLDTMCRAHGRAWMRMHVADLDASVCDVQTELNSFGFLWPVSADHMGSITRQFSSQACQILLFRLASFLDAQGSSLSDD